MASLKERLLSIEHDFLSALVHGEDAISAFNDRWGTLADDLSCAVDSAALDSETSLLAHTTATRLAALADTSVELFDSYNTITLQLMEQVDSMMSTLSLEDADNVYPAAVRLARPSRSHSKTLSPDDLAALPARPGCKRRAASSSEDDGSDEQRKRRRSSKQPVGRICRHNDTYLPSKHLQEPRSSDETRQVPTSPYSLSHNKSTPSPIRSSRKRRLSDTDVSFGPVPRKRFYLGPRLHTVSDTFITHQASSPVLHSRAPQELVLDSSTPLDLTMLQPSIEESIIPCQLDLPSDALQCHLGATDALSSEFNSLLDSLFDPVTLPTPPTPSPSSYYLAPLPHHQGVDAFCSASDSVSTAPSSPRSIFSSESGVHPNTPPPTYASGGVELASISGYLPNVVDQSPSWLPIPVHEESNTPSIALTKHPNPVYPCLGEQVTSWEDDNSWRSWFASVESCVSLAVSPSSHLSDLGLNISPLNHSVVTKESKHRGWDRGLVHVTFTEGCLV